MTILRMFFAGEIKRADVRAVGDKSVLEFSLCRKNFAKKDASPDDVTFTWVNVSVWDPKEFVVENARKGVFVAGSGDCELTSYIDKEGEKKPKLSIRTTGFDIEFQRGFSGDEEPAAQSEQRKAAVRPAENYRPRPAPGTVTYADDAPF
jgi:single-stranded DNA-binding protein